MDKQYLKELSAKIRVLTLVLRPYVFKMAEDILMERQKTINPPKKAYPFSQRSPNLYCNYFVSVSYPNTHLNKNVFSFEITFAKGRGNKALKCTSFNTQPFERLCTGSKALEWCLGNKPSSLPPEMLSNFLKDRIQSLYLIKYALQAIKKSDIILSQLKVKATSGSIPFFNGDIPAELKSRPEIKGSTSDIVMTVMKKLSNDLNIPFERFSDEFYRKSFRDVADNMTGRESVSL